MANQQKIEIQRIFKLQQDNRQNVKNRNAKQRIKKLTQLRQCLFKYRSEIKAAFKKDFGKPEAEVDLTEIFLVSSEIKFAKKNLKRWMRKKIVPTPIHLLGGSSWIHYEPKGTVLIIAPWNFPLLLVLGPLVSAVAAGNTAILKPSEFTPTVSNVMRKIVEEVFDENEVALIEGAVETSTLLLELPFDHIFFTGSPKVGKIVMTAAAKHLTSVTLELGGKSPTIVDETANLKQSVERIITGKYTNAGQVCIAPDYVFVHESKKEAFLEIAKATIEKLYSAHPERSADYCRLIHSRHLDNVNDLLLDAQNKGATLVHGGGMEMQDKFLEPTLITDIPCNATLMEEEIFGPVLPVLSYHDLEEVLAFINEKEKPLALYIFSKNRKNIQRLMNHTSSGGACINATEIHFSNIHLPFGGVNNSGIGRGHGQYGFEAFSNARAVYRQNFPGALDFLRPPFIGWKKRLIEFTLKWF